MTRVQKERFFNEEDYIRMKDCYILDKEKMKLQNRICTFCIRSRVSMRFPSKSMMIRVPHTLNRPERRICPYGSHYDITGGRKTMLNISGIREGVVLDHIQAGKSMDIYRYLRLGELAAPSRSSRTRGATRWAGKTSSRSRDRSTPSTSMFSLHRPQHHRQHHPR